MKIVNYISTIAVPVVIIIIVIYGILDIVDRFIFMKKINDYMKKD